MKKIIGFGLFTILVMGSFCQAHEIALTDSTILHIEDKLLRPFFNALKSGDVDEIKKHMSSSLYQKNRVLLEENMDYPAFLKNYYRNVRFSIVKAETGITSDDLIFHVSFLFPDGRSSINDLKVLRVPQAEGPGETWVVDNF